MNFSTGRKSLRNNGFAGYTDNINGRESVNSFDESSVKNSQSGTTDGGHHNHHKTSTLSANSTMNKANFMDSTETINRSNKRETLHSRFEFIKVLGKGTYGKVKLANDKRTGKQVTFLFRLVRNYFFLMQTFSECAV